MYCSSFEFTFARGYHLKDPPNPKSTLAASAPAPQILARDNNLFFKKFKVGTRSIPPNLHIKTTESIPFRPL